MSKFKRIVAGVLVAAMSVSLLAGCGKKGNAAHAKIDKNTVYREEELPVSVPENYYVNLVSFAGNKAFITGYVYDPVTYVQTNSVIIVDIATGESKTINLGTDRWINTTVPFDNGNVGVIYEENNTDFSDPENPVYDYAYIFEIYSPDGKSVAKKNLNKELGIEYTNSVLQIPGGLLLMSYDVLMVIDDKLNKVKEKRNENGQGFDFGNIYQLRDGSYVVMKWGETGQEYTRFDPQTLELGDKLDTWLSKNYNYSVLQGHGYDFLLRDSTQIYGYNVGDTDPTPLMNFINSDIYTSYFNAFDSLDERTFVGSYQEWDKEKNIFHLCKYNKVNPEDVKDKEIISLGCLYVND
ncbi:MAG: hypothetical protein ILP13_07085, partial [Lachnospiraceae bacterium]|nr:hypothetical protein [Lachnospiraceae bacterium]